MPPRPERRGPRDALPAAIGLALLGARALLRRVRRPPPQRKRPLFPRWSNRVFAGALATGALLLLGVVVALVWRAEQPAPSGFVAPRQPVPFSHQIHVTGLQIDCRYCHSAVERSSSAGMPSTRKCVPCHSEVWLESEPFAAVRMSLAENLPIPWRRVHDLPDFTYFHHGAHIQSGVGCESCHGRVDQMAVVRQVEPLSMEWCLNCHRQPEPFLRPRSEIVTMGWVPERPQEEVGAELKAEYGVAEMTHCTVCHR